MPSAFKQTAHSAASTRSSKQDSRAVQQRPRGNLNHDAKNQAEDPNKNEVQSAHLTEVDREWFNIRIKDLEEKLTRALSERQNFEKEAIAATQQLEKLQLDNGDIIQYLQRTLQSRDDQCSELKERLHGLQLAREKENDDFVRQLETSKRTLDNLDQRMQSEIKLLQGKLTSLEEFRVQKHLFENQIKEAHEQLKKKEQELPEHLERMERETVLRIETMREEHAAHIKEVTKEMEKLAITKLGDASRRALEENTMLLRQVAAVGGKLTLIESQLATARYQNQGLKALLQKTESKYADASKQLIAEKSKRKTQLDMEALLQRKIIQCEEQEKIITELQTENATIQKRLGHVEQERSRQQETLTELSHTSEKTRDNLSKIKKKYEILVQAVQSAKRVMAAVLAVDKENTASAMSQVIDFINEDFGC